MDSQLDIFACLAGADEKDAERDRIVEYLRRRAEVTASNGAVIMAATINLMADAVEANKHREAQA